MPSLASLHLIVEIRDKDKIPASVAYLKSIGLGQSLQPRADQQGP
jgi:hypothetical protein